MQRGFSLIELLIASAVTAAAGALLMGVLVAANRSADLRIERALLTQLLAGQLALLDDEINEQTPRSGTFPAPFTDVTWKLDQTEGPQPGLAQITLTVTRHGQTADVVTYRRLHES